MVTLVMVVSDSSDGSSSDTKLKNSNCDKTQKLQLRPNTKILNVKKLKKKKNSNCHKTKKENCDNSKLKGLRRLVQLNRHQKF